MLDRKKQKDELLGLKKRSDEEEEQTEEQLLVQESKKSYFTLEQYNQLNKRINDAHHRMKEQQGLIERLDKGVHDTLVKIRERRKALGQGSALSM